MSEKMVPVIKFFAKTTIAQIPWSMVERAYQEYARLYGRRQSLSQIYDRGGFHPRELDKLYPEWRAQPGVIHV